MTRTLAVIAIAAALTVSAQAPLPQFEVATVKSPGPQDRMIARFNYPGGRVVYSMYTFAQLIQEALGAQRFQVVGAPDWIDSQRFMIEAKPAATSKLSSFTPSNREAPLVDEQRRMLLALLEDRFHLQFHRETKDDVVYLLTKEPKEPKLVPPQHPETRMYFAGLLGGRDDGTVSGGNATMEFIAQQLSRSMGGVVLDRTGLAGPFDFELEHVYDPEERDLVAIAQRTVSALGLKLEKSRGPVETIVIDHVERPSAN